jgi:hypothetical protein
VNASFFQRLLFVALLGSSVVVLSACGKSTVQSSNPETTTMMNPDVTPVAGESNADNSTIPVNSYVEKNSSSNHSAIAKGIAPSTTAPASILPTPAQTMAQIATPAVESPAPVKKSGSHFLWWLLLFLILVGIGWYFWSKNHADEDEFQPHPPSGGLSPVSGFTGIKHQLEPEASKPESFWTKKLF